MVAGSDAREPRPCGPSHPFSSGKYRSLYCVYAGTSSSLSIKQSTGSAVMKSLFFVAALICVASLAACSFKEERVGTACARSYSCDASACRLGCLYAAGTGYDDRLHYSLVRRPFVAIEGRSAKRTADVQSALASVRIPPAGSPSRCGGIS
jgi:hypothetical protein